MSPRSSSPKQRRHKKRRHLAEPLEERVLLVADPFYSASESRSGTQLELRIDSGLRGSPVILVDVTTQKTVASVPLSEVDGPLRIIGSKQNDALTISIDTRTADALLPLGVLFEAGAGRDDVLGPGADTTWFVNGIGSGQIGEKGTVRFIDVENLRGQKGNQDTFVVSQKAEFAGVLDGGADGFDSLIVRGRYSQVHSKARNAHAGQIELDGKRIQYDGLEPITFEDAAADLTITGSDMPDTMTVDNEAVAGRMTVSSPGTMETHVFPVPTNSLTVEGGLGDDRVIIQGHDNALNATVNVDGQAGEDRIEVIAGTSFDAGSGNINFVAEGIAAHIGSVISTTGDIVFAANNALGSLGNLDNSATPNVTAVVSVDGATILGNNVSLTADASLVSAIVNDLLSPLAVLNATLRAEVQVTGASSITSSGSFVADATSDINATVTATARNLAIAEIAVASPTVNTTARTRLSDTSTVAATGDLDLRAITNTIVNSTATGVQGLPIPGTTVAAPMVTTTSEALIEDSAAISQAASIDIDAISNSNVATTANATPAGAAMNPPSLAALALSTPTGPVQMAAALATPTYTPDTRAAIVSSGSLVSAGPVNVTATSNHNVGTDANATPVVSVLNDGAAVATNFLEIEDEAFVGAPGVTVNISAPQLNIRTRTDGDPQQFTTIARSGAAGIGNANMGVVGGAQPGALALTTQTICAAVLTAPCFAQRSDAYIADGTTLNLPNGNTVLQIDAQNAHIMDTTAEPEGAAAIGGNLGVGRSVATNVTSNTTRAVVGLDPDDAAAAAGVTIAGAQSVDVLANGNALNRTTALAGALAGNNAHSESVAAVAAINSTEARINTGANLVVAGPANVEATHLGNSITRSRSNAAANGLMPGSVSTATPLALNAANDRAIANVAGSVQSIGDFDVSSNLDTDNQVEAIAGTQGANPAGTTASGLVADEIAFLQDRTNLYFGAPIAPPVTTPILGTPDGQVGDAAALAVDISIADSNANVVSTATVDVSTGQLNVIATGDADSNSIANASTVNNVSGTAIGTALSALAANTIATIGGNVTADAISLHATTIEDGEHSINANARSGAGTTDVGVAGAFAGTLSMGATSAIVDDGAILTLTPGGDLIVHAETNLANAADARPGVHEGTVVGVGGSVELNGGNFLTTSEIRNATIGGADDVQVTSNGMFESVATANAGASNASSFPGAVAMLMTNFDTVANLRNSANASTITGDLVVAATHHETGQHAASASSEAQDVGAAGAIAIGVTQGGAQAFNGGNIQVGGNTSISANSRHRMNADATASEAGVDGETPNAATVTDQQLANMIQFLGGAGIAPAVQDVLDHSRAGTADGAIGAAAALAANYDFSATLAGVTPGATLTSAGDVVVNATSDNDVDSFANANTVNSEIGVGVAVAANVTSFTTQAFVAGDVTAPNLTVESLLGDDEVHNVRARAISGAGDNDEVGVAGAFAQNVSVQLPLAPLVIPLPTIPPPPPGVPAGATPTLPMLVIPAATGSRHAAEIQNGANISLPDTGDLLVRSFYTGEYVAEALPEPNESNVYGIGASVAVNAINHTTLAEIQSATITAENIFVLSVGDYDTSANADAGATDAANLPAAIAMNYTDVHTISNVDVGANAGDLPGRLLVQANHIAEMTHEVDTESGVGTASVGAAISLGLARGGARASSGLTANIAETAWVLAHNASNMNADAISGQSGAQADPANVTVTEETERQAEALLAVAGLPEIPEDIVRVLQVASAETADGSVGVAAAIAANLDLGTSVATTTGGTMTLPESPLVRATADMNVDAFADASTVGADAGVGVAVAINADRQHVESSLGGNITAPSFSVSTTSGAEPSSFRAHAVSGAGADDVGVAGAFAINISDPFNGGRHIARIADNAVLTISDDGDDTNDNINVSATYNSAHLALATAIPDGGGTVGIGPSVAINAASHDALAEIGNAIVHNATDIQVTANGTHTPQTQSFAGALSQGAFPAAVALTAQSNDSIARLTPAENASHITGNLQVTANHDATTTTVANSVVAADEVGIGAAIAAGGPLGGGQAVAGANMIVDGEVIVLADTTTRVNADAASLSVGPLLGLFPIDVEARRQLRRLADLVGVDEFLFPSFDPNPPLSAIFNAETDVDADNDTIRIDSPHSFDNGDAVIYRNNNDDTNVGDLDDEDTYYVSVDTMNENLLRLHTSFANAINGVNPISLAPIAVAEDRHTLLAERLFDPNTAVDESDDEINVGDFSGLTDGDAVRYFNEGGGNVGGLADGGLYYVNVDSSDVNNITIRFFKTRSASIVGENAINLDLNGTNGAGHRISRVVDGFSSQRLAFNPVTAVDTATNVINTNSVRGLETGDAIIYRSYGDASVGALVDGDRYYINVDLPEDGDMRPPRISLHATKGDASSGDNRVNLVALDSLTQRHEFVPAHEFDPNTDVDDERDTIDFSDFAGLSNGSTVLYQEGGDEVGGLVGEAVYYVVFEFPSSGRAWLFDSESDAKKVIEARDSKQESDDAAGVEKKKAKVDAASQGRRIDLDASAASGTEHFLELVGTLTRPEETFLPKRRFGGTASIAIGASLPDSIATVGAGANINTDGALNVTSQIDFASDANATVLGVEGIGLSVAGNYSQVTQTAEIGAGATVVADSVTLQAIGTDDQLLRYTANAAGGAVGFGANVAGSLAANAMNNQISTAIRSGANVMSSTDVNLFANVREVEVEIDGEVTHQIIDAGGVLTNANAGNATLASVAAGASGAGALTLDGDTIETLVESTAAVVAQDDITLHAEGNQTFLSTANAQPFAIPLGLVFSGSLGAAFTRTQSEISSEVQGNLQASSGKVTLVADGTSARTSVAIGLGASPGIAAGAAAVSNISRNRTATRIDGGADVTAAGDVTLESIDDSTYSADSNGLAGAVAAGASVGFASNLVANSIVASIDGTNTIVATAGDVSLDATTDPSIVADAISISVGVLNAAGGGVSINETDSLAEAGIQQEASVTADTVHINALTTVSPQTTVSGAQGGILSAASLMVAQSLVGDSAKSEATGNITTNQLDVLAHSTRNAETDVVMGQLAIFQGEVGFEGEATAGTTEVLIGAGANIQIGGNGTVNAMATSNDTADVHLADAELDIFSAGAMSSFATAGSNTLAAVSGEIDARVVDVTATATKSADAQTTAVGVAIVGLNGVALPKIANALPDTLPIPLPLSFDTEAVATVDGNVSASVTTGANITTTEGLSVVANSTNTANSHMAGGGINVIDVSSTSSQAHVLGSTAVVIEEGSSVDVGTFTTSAEANNNIEARGTFAGVEGVTVDLADVQAIANHDVVARIGPNVATEVNNALNGSLMVGDGGINLNATSTNIADVRQVDVAISAVSVEVIRPVASTRGSTRAYVGGQFEMDTNVTATADATNRATSRAVNVEVEAIDVSVNRDSVSTKHQTEAFVTPNASLMIMGDLNLNSTAENEAKLQQTDALNINGVEVFVLSSRVDAGGATNAYVDRGSTVNAEEVNLNAAPINKADVDSFNLGIAAVDVDVVKPDAVTTHVTNALIGAVPDVRRKFNPADSVSADTIAIVVDHTGLVNGDRIQYRAGKVGEEAAMPINGLTSGNSYFVSIEKRGAVVLVRFHNTRSNAVLGIGAIGISTANTTGTAHEIVKTTEIGEGNAGSVVASNDISLIADSRNEANLDEIGVNIGAVSVGVIKPDVNAGGSTAVQLGGNYSYTGDLTGHANSFNKAESLSVAVEITGIDIEVPTKAIETTHTTSSFIDSSANLTSNDSISLTSSSVNTAGLDEVGVDIAAINVAVTDLTARVGGETRSYVSPNAIVNSTGLSLSSNATNEAKAHMVTVGVAGVEVDVSNSHAVIDHNTETYIGTKAEESNGDAITLDVTGPGISMSAISNNIANADTTSVNAAAITVGVLSPKADVAGSTSAHVSGNVTMEGSSVDMSVDSNSVATAEPVLVGIGAIAGGGAVPEATITHVVEAYLGTQSTEQPEVEVLTSIVTTGDVTVAANGSMTANATADGGGAAGITITAMLPQATVSGAIRSYVREDVGMESRRLTVTAGEADDPAIQTAMAEAFVVGIGAISGVGTNVDATVDGSVEAFIGSPVGSTAVDVPGSQIQLRNAARFGANSSTRSEAITEGGSGGAVTVDVMLPTAVNNGNTRAYAGQLAEMEANEVDFTANAHQQRAIAKGSFTRVAIAGGSGADVRSTLGGAVEAFIEGAEIESNTALGVTAQTQDSLATAEANLGTGGVLDVSAALAKAENRNTTLAFIENSTIPNAQNLAVLANSKDRANSNGQVKGGGVIRGAGTHAVTEMVSTTEAYIGNQVEIDAGNTVSVRAIADTAEGDANAESAGGGAINVGVAFAELEVAPTVEAHIAGQHNNDAITTNIRAMHVEILADLRSVPVGAMLSDNFNQQNAVDLSQDSITFAQHGRQDGDVVTYSNNGNANIQTPGSTGEVEEDREYSVIRISDDQLQLGATFSGSEVDTNDPFATASGQSGVDPTADVIVTSSPHNFVIGDAVKYHNGGFQNVSVDLINVDEDPTSLSTTFFVRRIDDFSFKLASTISEAQQAATTFDAQVDGLVTDGNTLNINGHGFSNGDRVTYRAPENAAFRSPNVDLNVDGSGNPTGDNADADNIFLGQDANGDGVVETHSLQDGDKVTYRVESGGLAIGGINNGQEYFVIRTSAYTIQLADSLCEAVGCDDIEVSPIELEPNKATEGEGIPPAEARHLLIPDALGNLQSGRTYTVSDVSPNQFRLRNDNDTIVSVAVGDAFGDHSIGVEGMELQATSGQHALRIDLVGPTANVSNGLFGPLAGDPPQGVSLRTITPPTGDGVSSGSAKGSGGGILEVEVPTARIDYLPNVIAYVAADEIDAEGNVTIHSESNGTVSGYTDSRAGGFIKVGRTESDVDIRGTTNSFVGLPAAGVNVAEISGETDAVQIQANGVDIRAEHFQLSSQSELDSSSTASAKGGGFIATARATASNDVDANTNAVVGRNARIEAETVDVDVLVDGIFTFARAEATAGGLTGSAKAIVNNNVTSLANVLLEGTAGGDTQITGTKGVDISVDQGDILMQRSGRARFFGLGPSDVEGNNQSTIESVVDADPGVLVTAGPRILAGPGVPNADVTPLETPTTGGISNLALFVDIDSQTDDAGPDDLRTIHWDADAEILSGPSPELVINEAGQIIKAINISVDGGKKSGFVSDIFSVDDVTNNDPGEVLFRTNQDGPDAVINNPTVEPDFTFRFTFEEVLITNRSDFTMTVNNIDPFNRVPERPLIAIAVVDELVPIEFDVRYAWEPTFVSIQHLADSLSQVRVIGVIDNPIGRTELVSTSLAGNSDGEVPVLRVGFNGGLVRTNELDIFTTRGSYSVNAQLVQSEGRPTHYTSVVEHPGTSYLRVQGLLRDPNEQDFVVNIDSIVTPGTMLIDYLKSIREIEPVFQQLLTDVNEVPLGDTTVVSNHFRPIANLVVFQQLPIGAFGTDTQKVDSTYDFQFVEADFLRIQLFGEPCSEILTGIIVNWEEPGSGVIFDGPGTITTNDNDGDGRFGDLTILKNATLLPLENFDPGRRMTGFFASRDPLDSISVAFEAKIEFEGVANLRLAREFEIGGVLDVEVGGDAHPLVASTLRIGPRAELQLHAEERYAKDGDQLQVVLSADRIDGSFRTTPRLGAHVGRGIFVADHDGDGASIRTTRSRNGVELQAELYQAVQGDVDGNGAVDFSDFLTFSSNFGSGGGPRLVGDFDKNGVVEFADFLTFAKNFGRQGTRLDGDFNRNGVVDFPDFLTFAANFGRRTVTWLNGDFDGNGNVEFADFLNLSATFGRRRDVAATDQVLAQLADPPQDI